jgi:hypothetical protein
MDAILAWLLPLLQNVGSYASAVDAVVLALIALFLLIPGDQPEKALRGVADFIEKFSKK